MTRPGGAGFSSGSGPEAPWERVWSERWYAAIALLMEARRQLRLSGSFQRVERRLWVASVAAASELSASLYFSGAELAGKGLHAGVADGDLTLAQFHSSSCAGAGAYPSASNHTARMQTCARHSSAPPRAAASSLTRTPLSFPYSQRPRSTSTSSRASSAARRTRAPSWPRPAPRPARRSPSARARRVRTWHSANARAAAHISGRPGPEEPAGFLVVPGRGQGCARQALRSGAGVCALALCSHAPLQPYWVKLERSSPNLFPLPRLSLPTQAPCPRRRPSRCPTRP
jgi:hypothetical protein